MVECDDDVSPASQPTRIIPVWDSQYSPAESSIEDGGFKAIWDGSSNTPYRYFRTETLFSSGSHTIELEIESVDSLDLTLGVSWSSTSFTADRNVYYFDQAILYNVNCSSVTKNYNSIVNQSVVKPTEIKKISLNFDYDDRKIWWIINENIETEHYDFTPDCEEVFITCGMRCGSATFI